MLTVLMGQDSISTNISCNQCHTPNQWMPLNPNMEFHHNSTFFPLTGKHTVTNCIQCHNGHSIIERHHFSEAESDCQSCHLDIHYGDFGFSCEDCHTTTDWTHNNLWKGHDYTFFPLVGSHKFLQCNQCHNSTPEILIDSECYSCHAMEYHAALSSGNHPENTSCEFCHNAQDFTSFEVGRHDVLFFPINSGGHKGEWSTCTAECHYNPSDYSQFSCGLNGVCHEHDQNEMDDEHDDENDYVYDSFECLSCHPSP